MPIVVQYQSVRVVVNSLSLFAPGGDVNEWCQKIAYEIKTAAVKNAPPNRSSSRRPLLRKGQSTGALVASIYRTAYQVGDGKEISIEVGAAVPYAKYVHEGTAAQGRNYIYTTLGYDIRGDIADWIDKGFFEASADEQGFYMPLPRAYYPQRFYLRVHGQRANPFITDAYTEVARAHGALPAKRFARTLLSD